MQYTIRYVALLLLCCMFAIAQANDTAYVNRQAAYRAISLANLDNDAMSIQAYEGVPVTIAELNYLVNNLPTKSTVDFDIVKLVRVLELSNGEYDTLILPGLLALPYWINYGDTLRGYWSENHMIQWMSSDWLLHEKYNKPIDANLRNRLLHYLQVKVNYGYYEFFSSVYAPYAFAGLVNLADFSQDAEIKQWAIRASQRLLKDLLILTNDKGVFFPAAGRNYFGKYETPYGQNHNSLIYMLTGRGEVPTSASHAGAFLATSTLPVDSVIESYTNHLDYVYHIGHTLEEGFVINSGLTPLDRTIAQWSSGAYFHPVVAEETATLLNDSNMWEHVDFGAFEPLKSMTPQTIAIFANTLNVASTSSLYCGEDVAIFKNNSITLSSIQDYHKGKVGYQQMACVANVGTTAVMTAAGRIVTPWHDKPETNISEHLPYVRQHSNVALLMYRPQFTPDLLPFHNKEVALFFQKDDYDEVIEDSLWLLGRQGSGYVAVRRHCADSLDGVMGCTMDRGQTWVIMVGDSTMYGSFSNFKNIVHNSVFETSWTLRTDTAPNQYVYYSRIQVDTVDIAYAWNADSVTNVGIAKLDAAHSFELYPNPASNMVKLNLNDNANGQAMVRITDMLGNEVYKQDVPALMHTINVEAWAKGMYLVSVQTPSGISTKRFVKE